MFNYHAQHLCIILTSSCVLRYPEWWFFLSLKEWWKCPYAYLHPEFICEQEFVCSFCLLSIKYYSCKKWKSILLDTSGLVKIFHSSSRLSSWEITLICSFSSVLTFKWQSPGLQDKVTQCVSHLLSYSQVQPIISDLSDLRPWVGYKDTSNGVSEITMRLCLPLIYNSCCLYFHPTSTNSYFLPFFFSYS